MKVRAILVSSKLSDIFYFSSRTGEEKAPRPVADDSFGGSLVYRFHCLSDRDGLACSSFAENGEGKHELY